MADADLLALALSRPNDALAQARAVLARGPGPVEASVAHQAIGIVLREFGDIDAAVRELRTACRLARRGSAADREADALATLGVALVFAGRTRSGRNALNGAVLQSTGLLRGRTLLRRGGCLRVLGQRREALADLNGAIAALRSADDQIWEARALVQRSLCHLSAGTVKRAATDLARAGDLFAANGQDLESADVVMLHGLIALRLGDLPDALARFDEAADLYTALGFSDADLSAHRCEALSAAGLASDALRAADATIGELVAAGGQLTKRAELLLVAANCALAAGDPAAAADRAAEAARMFGRQGRTWWRAHARLTRVRAAAQASPATKALLADALRCVRELSALNSPELPLALLAAGRAALTATASTGGAGGRGGTGGAGVAGVTGVTGDARGAGVAAAGQPASARRAEPGNSAASVPAAAPPSPARRVTLAAGQHTGTGYGTQRRGGSGSYADPPRPARGGPPRSVTGPGTPRPRDAARLRAEADELLAAAAAGRRHGPALTRATAWLAQALRAEAAGDGRGLMLACRHGLSVIDEFRGVFGSSELRARSTAHGTELAALGLRHAARLGRPRLMLEWSERWRAVALAVPPVRPPDDEALRADLAALRDVTARLAKAAAARQPTGPHEQERQRLERAVRARSLRTASGTLRADAGSSRPDLELSFPVARLLAELGADRLVELVDVDGELHALVCGSGQVRRYPVGLTADAARAVRFARQALRRVAHGPPVSPDAATVHAWLAALGDKLDQTLLGGAGDRLGAGDVIIVPPGHLQAVPWALLPRLRSRVLSVSPSAASWLRARQAGRAAGPVVLVRGPGLVSGGAEVPLVAADYAADARGGRHPPPVVLGGGTATAERVLAALDGAGLAHVAAHGTFRADSPLFSALQLDDGPLTVYDLERLRQGPRRLVLSSCDSGVTTPAGADEVLGLASSLLPLGTTGIVASVVPVDDAAVVPLMTALHRELRAGATLPEALRNVRPGPEADPAAAAAGWSFICLGA